MSKEKQMIEEMACFICESRKANWADGCRVCNHHENRCLYQDIACSLYNAGYRKQSELTPCDVCKFNPPTSGDNKPCLICPAQMKGGAE